VGAFKNLAGEIAYLRGALRTLNRVKPIKSAPHLTISERMEAVCHKFADRPALIWDGQVLTFREFDARVNQIARWAKNQGVGKGDTVALLMPNCPDYLAIWLGIARAGGATALLNTGQAGQALGYSVSIVKPKLAIIAASLLQAYRDALPHIDTPPSIFVHRATDDHTRRIDQEIQSYAADPLAPNERVTLSLDDRCVYVYTSGTTGLPKAANINHYRVNAMALGFSAVMDVRPSDRIYDCLPMYHSNGGILAILGVLIQGGSVVIRDKLSVREFWTDITTYGCTLFFYIGEVCRYLLSAPPSPLDRQHHVRLICGNGLRPDIWDSFSGRFGIRHIREFYGATEGNIALFNFDSRPGAIGRIPKWAEKRFVVKVVKYDVETEKPIRDSSGRCILCAPGEVGEIIGEIIDDPMAPANRFEGYADQGANDSKILRDVFRAGDAWFRSGDLVTRDADGYFYFVDRVGDTFRWKGENVSTSEVAETINAVPGVVASAVYGLSIPGHDGKAGMAAILLSDHEPFDLDRLSGHIIQNLPAHARPVFLRLQRAMDVTGTFKIRKLDLIREGLAPNNPEEPVYWLHHETNRYHLLDESARSMIESGLWRV
jgi:fatty-acyl-CoA synthase